MSTYIPTYPLPCRRPPATLPKYPVFPAEVPDRIQSQARHRGKYQRTGSGIWSENHYVPIQQASGISATKMLHQKDLSKNVHAYYINNGAILATTNGDFLVGDKSLLSNLARFT